MGILNKIFFFFFKNFADEKGIDRWLATGEFCFESYSFVELDSSVEQRDGLRRPEEFLSQNE